MKIRELIKTISIKRGEANPFPDDIESFIADFALNDLAKSDTLQAAFEISQLEMEQLYRDAYTFYQAGRLEDAAFSFRYLVLFNPYVKKHWMGLGATLQLKNAYEKALKAYAIATLLDSKDPYPHYHAFECYQAIGNGEESYKALECAYIRAMDNPIFNSLKMKIQSLKIGSKE